MRFVPLDKYREKIGILEYFMFRQRKFFTRFTEAIISDCLLTICLTSLGKKEIFNII